MTKLDLVALFVMIMIMIMMIGMMMVMMLKIVMMKMVLIMLMVRCFILQLSHQKTNQAFFSMFVMAGQQTVSLYISYHMI